MVVPLATCLSQSAELGPTQALDLFSQSCANLMIHLSSPSINQFLIDVAVSGFVKFPGVSLSPVIEI